jgi:hypothetical protein
MSACRFPVTRQGHLIGRRFAGAVKPRARGHLLADLSVAGSAGASLVGAYSGNS